MALSTTGVLSACRLRGSVPAYYCSRYQLSPIAMSTVRCLRYDSIGSCGATHIPWAEELSSSVPGWPLLGHSEGRGRGLPERSLTDCGRTVHRSFAVQTRGCVRSVGWHQGEERVRDPIRWRRSARRCGAGSRPPSRGRRLRRRGAGRRSPVATNALICAPTGSGKTLASFLWGIDKLARSTGARDRRPARLRLAAESALLRHRAQPAGAAARDRRRDLRRPADRRHLAERTAGDGENPAGHPHHHPGVALPDALLERPRDPRHDRGGDRRRDSRCRPDQARVASGPDAGAARPSVRWRPSEIQRIGLSATQRPLERIGKFLVGPKRECRIVDAGAEEGAGPGDRGAGGGHGRPGRSGLSERGRRRRRPKSSPPPMSARSGRRSTPSSWSWSRNTPRRCLRQQPASCGAPGQAAERACQRRRRTGAARHRARRATSASPPARPLDAQVEIARAHHGSLSHEERTDRRGDAQVRASCPAWSRPARWSWVSTWARSTW